MSEAGSEFDIIQKHFASLSPAHPLVALGPGDDAAVLNVKAGQQSVVSMDTLVAGQHFPLDTMPYDIAYKAVMVNLSDLAAMGADPATITLALTVPESNDAWFTGFARGLQDALRPSGTILIGGDLTRGPLSVTMQAQGWVPEGEAVLRSGAHVGDLIYVSGELGAGALGLQILLGRMKAGRGETDQALAALQRPVAQLTLGKHLRAYASAMIDISDGLVSDLNHILKASAVGADIRQIDVPVATCVMTAAGLDKAWDLAWAGGDDYQLCFTAPPSQRQAIQALSEKLGILITPIGACVAELGCRLIDGDNQRIESDMEGFRHF